MNRRNFTQCLLGLPAAMSIGVQANAFAVFPEKQSSTTLLVTLPGLISDDLAYKFRKQSAYTIANDWKDISEIWYDYLADDVRDKSFIVRGLTQQSHYFAVSEFSRGRHFDFSAEEISGVCIEHTWSDKQLLAALAINTKYRFHQDNLPKGEHSLTSWSLVFNPTSHEKIASGVSNATR